MRVNKGVFLLFLCLMSCAGNVVKVRHFGDSSSLIIRENGSVKKVPLGKGNPRFYKINEFGGNVYVGFENGKIVKIGREEGKILWEKELGAPVNVDFGFDENNVYFVSTNNDFHVLDQLTGETRFIYYNSNKTTILNRVAPAVVNGGISVVFNDGKTILFDRNNIFSRI